MRWLSWFAGLLCVVILEGCAPTRRQAQVVQEPASTGTPPSRILLPGQQPDGSILLPNQWSLRPAGRQVDLGDFPVNVAVHPGGRFAVVLHCGFSAHELRVVDVASGTVFGKFPLHEAFYGLEFSADGRQLYCSGAGDEVVHVFDFRDGALSNHKKIQLRPPSQRAVVSGLTVGRSGRHLYSANLWGDRITKVTLGAAPEVHDILLGTNGLPLAVSPAKDDSDFDTMAAEKREETQQVIGNAKGSYPYACKLDEKRRRLYVSLWGEAVVAVVDLNAERVLAYWHTDEHPCEMALTRSGKYLFVANANRNTVTIFDTDAGKAVQTIWAALYPQSPPGSTPNSLALTPDEKLLFVANACNNAVAVFDVSNPARSRSLGFIPVGWYPTSVRVTPDGKHLLVANGKGVHPRANPFKPEPGVGNSANRTFEYIAQLLRGTLSIIELPAREKFEHQMAVYNAQAYECCPLKADASVTGTRTADNPIPAKPGDPSPLKYCVYIVKENRTYDQMLGDMPEGNGDPSLCLFPERTTPNHHRLAREFVLLDNFYVDAEVSADGHEWSMGAYATDFVEKMWPMSYGHNRARKYFFPAEGFFAIATPAGGYLWDRAAEAGVSYRSYGEFVTDPVKPGGTVAPRLPSLRGHIDPKYRGFDLNYSDLDRAARFIEEIHRFELTGDMPRLQIVRLPNDHTHGSSPGRRAPTAYVAENDLALGKIIEALSHSRFWPQMAIFVLEDDAQNGPDHVDAHRSLAFVISPYTKRAVVDSTLYSTSSMLRTIELILGLKPMSQFDAAARPMFTLFQAAPDLRPYDCLPAQVDLNARNPEHAWGGDIKMNFAKEDAADDLLLNEVIWRSVRGANSPMPAPVRAAFVRTRAGDDDDD